jgi:hypothetical protein
VAERDRRLIRAKSLEDLEAIRGRCRTLAGFVREAWHVLEPTTRYVHDWHHDVISEHLEAIHRGEITRLQINQPPGTAKSFFASVCFNAWEWGPGSKPGMRYLTTAYMEKWARTHARKTRDLVTSEWYRTLWPNVALVRDNEMDFENTSRGARTAMPFASLTSGRGNRVIIDDPHSTEQVESDADRERAERIFRESVTSRLNDPQRDAIVVIMHRLHPDDLCGVIEQLGLPYVKLVLPMEYVRSVTVKTPWFEDPRKEEREILVSPERLPREKLEQIKVELGSYGYDPQYQQQPRGREGTEFFSTAQLLVDGHPVEAPTMCGAVFAVIDSATKTGNEHDGTAVVYAALTNPPDQRLVILDWDIVQIEGSLLEAWLPEVFARLEELARETRARSGSVGVCIEDKASGMILLQQAARRGWPAHPIPSKLATVGKSERAISVSGYVNKGWVKITKHAYEKVTIYKGRSRNHLLSQITGFRIGVQDRDDDLFDAWVYSIALGLGNAKGF